MTVHELNNYFALQEVIRRAVVTFKKATDQEVISCAWRPTCLVTSFGERSDVPAGTIMVKMSPRVVDALNIMGLHEPVSLKLLPGMWWVVRVDVSSDNPNIEAGGATMEVVTATEQLIHHYCAAYCEVINGPFEFRAAADQAFASL